MFTPLTKLMGTIEMGSAIFPSHPPVCRQILWPCLHFLTSFDEVGLTTRSLTIVLVISCLGRLKNKKKGLFIISIYFQFQMKSSIFYAHVVLFVMPIYNYIGTCLLQLYAIKLGWTKADKKRILFNIFCNLRLLKTVFIMSISHMDLHKSFLQNRFLYIVHLYKTDFEHIIWYHVQNTVKSHYCQNKN